jgi:CRISPR-associated exonuclease Cas4
MTMREGSEHITVGDLKQWAYCPRVVYYHKLMAGCGIPTRKMEAGAQAQEWLEPIELRRTLSRYGFREARRRTGLSLRDFRLGLAGKIDWLIEDGKQAAVVECKLTAGEPAPNHAIQLAGYAWLIERLYGWQVPVGFVYRVPDARLFAIPIGEPEREAVRAAMGGIRNMLKGEIIPAPTDVRARCRDCEYANFCGDIW